MPSHKLIHASPPQSQNVLWTYLCGTQMESWIRLWTYPCVTTMESWNRPWTYQHVNSRIILWNCQTGSEHTHLSHRRNSGSGSECTWVLEMEFWNRLWTYACHRDVILEQPLNVPKCQGDRILKQPLNVPRCHRNRFLEQALNVPMCHIWNSGRGSERTHVSQMEFWYRLWMHSVRDRILDQALNVPMCHRWNCGIGFDCIHLSWR